MSSSGYDVIGIGNAIVDVLAKMDEAFLATHKLVKGAMTLIDAPTASHLYSALGPAIECSGGSAANTMAGIASLGGRAAFIGIASNLAAFPPSAAVSSRAVARTSDSNRGNT